MEISYEDFCILIQLGSKNNRIRPIHLFFFTKSDCKFESFISYTNVNYRLLLLLLIFQENLKLECCGRKLDIKSYMLHCVRLGLLTSVKYISNTFSWLPICHFYFHSTIVSIFNCIYFALVFLSNASFESCDYS